ncbi:DUF2516 family protein [Lipingzhangella sp. LS1_29]|uniref:DUF2516 family protein n=1 Tax=Lipingzhangella rawalii TaxID=2055835 RepID=A0ABU2H4L7_9ACTN|nr:DUF2516 family protein [Lipingzhangella rawalii]MDS1270243.1 DUF2516 family protein [Lipingzhangella rawalii]
MDAALVTIPGVTSVANILFWLIFVAVFVVSLYALVDAAKRPAEAFVATDKQTKQLWLILLGVATLVGFITVFGGSRILFLTIAAGIVAGIYLLDVRPALNAITGGRGPYGPR